MHSGSMDGRSVICTETVPRTSRSRRTSGWSSARRGESASIPCSRAGSGRRVAMIASEGDVRDVIELMRLNYERVLAKARPAERRMSSRTHEPTPPRPPVAGLALLTNNAAI